MSKFNKRPKYKNPVIREHDNLRAHGFLAEVVLRICYKVGGIFRGKRLERFQQLFPISEYPELLDVGGTFSFWAGTSRKVTIVNPLAPPSQEGNVTSVPGDGRDLPFPDKAFGLVFSNSAIEHMSHEDMRRFAAELSRVGVGLYCQTPNLWFPYDTHYIAFFFHWWPGMLRNYFVARYLTGWGWVYRPDRKAVEDWANAVQLMGEREFRSLFPDCVIEREKFLGMTKSFVAIRHVPDRNEILSSKARKQMHLASR
ncbi:MAG: class I SAM-dependent methyltransferase [Terracidiphilus sp.]|jgi:hypothetical protein